MYIRYTYISYSLCIMIAARYIRYAGLIDHLHCRERERERECPSYKISLGSRSLCNVT